MKTICTKLACLLLVLLVGGMAKAESIASPNGQLQLNFSVNAQGEPVYELSYKGKTVINPSKLGLELKNDPGLMNGFTLADAKTSTFDETWEPVWGEVKQIRNHYNELAVTLNQKAQDRNIVIRFRDNGPGISPKNRKLVFKPFRRTKDATNSRKPGVGLGLALARDTARSLGGDLKLEFGTLGGASFLLTIPKS